MPRIIAYSATSRVERNAPCYRVRPPPHRTVRAVFPHTALRVGLVSSVSLPFAPRLRFTLIPMDAPPCGRAVSDAPPHSGLSPIAVFRHYYSRHLICIVPFTRRGPSHPRTLPRFPATTASSDYCSRLRAPACAPFGLPSARSPPNLWFSGACPLCPARALAVGFAVASGDLPSGLRPSAHAPPKPKSNWPRGVDFTHRDLLVTRI